jgi:hypothetical protein
MLSKSIFVRRVDEDHSTDVFWKCVVHKARKQPAERLAHENIGTRLICPQQDFVKIASDLITVIDNAGFITPRISRAPHDQQQGTQKAHEH